MNKQSKIIITLSIVSAILLILCIILLSKKNNSSCIIDNDVEEVGYRELYKYEVHDEWATNFNAFQVGKLFVLVSAVNGKQCFQHNVIIFDNNGKTLQSYEHAEVAISSNSIRLKISDSGECSDTTAKNIEFVVEGNKLIIKDSLGSDVEYVKK